MRPETRYARSAGGYVAYQVLGEGATDLLFVTNWSTNLDAMWEEPSLAHFFHRLTRMGRVICFDKRGTGVSDPVPLAALPTLEESMDDARVACPTTGYVLKARAGDPDAPAIEWRGSTGYAALPGCRHRSGELYEVTGGRYEFTDGSQPAGAVYVGRTDPDEPRR